MNELTKEWGMKTLLVFASTFGFSAETSGLTFHAPFELPIRFGGLTQRWRDILKKQLRRRLNFPRFRKMFAGLILNLK